MKERLLCVCLWLVCSLSLRAQVLHISVTDSTGQGLPHAEVLVKRGTILERASLDVRAEAHIASFQALQLYVSHVGFQNQEIQPSWPWTDTLELKIVLLPVDNLLNGVEIRQRKSRLDLVEGGYKISFSENSTLRDDLLSLMRTVPGMRVSSDDISILGASGIKVFVDGRQILLQGRDLLDFLRSMDARNIKDISVIQMASAKYEADNAAAILEITTRKLSNSGITNRISTGLVSHHKAYVVNSTTLNAKNLSVNLNLRLNHTDTYFKEISELEEDAVKYEQRRKSRTAPGNGFQVNGSVNYNLTARDNVYFMQVNNWYRGTSRVELHTSSSLGHDLENQVDYLNVNRRSNTAITYRRDLKKKGSTFRTDFTRHFLDSDVFADDRRENQVLKSSFASNLKTNLWNADYTGVIDSLSSVMAGLRWNKIARETAFVGGDLSNAIDFSERISAAYLIYLRQTNGYSLNLGLRAESTHTLVTGTVPFDLSYTDIFPSAIFTKILRRSQRLTLNYARNIQRPKYANYTHVIDNTNPLWQKVGNARSKASYGHSARLNYAVQNDKGSILTMIGGFQWIKGDMGRIYMPAKSEGVFLDTLVRYKGLKIASFELVGSRPLGKWGSISSSIRARQVNMDAIPEVGLSARKLLTFVMGINFNADLKRNFSMQVSAFGNTRQLGTQSVNYGVAAMDIYLSKYFSKAKVQTFFEVLDLFDTNRSRSYSNAEALIMRTYHKYETQMITVGASWSFGKTKATQVKRRQAENDSRMD